MKDNDIKKHIRLEIEKETPDVLDNILSKCKRKEKEKMKKQFLSPRFILSMASILIILVLISVFVINKSTFQKVDSTIEIDVNPSIELKIDKQNKIIETTALNDDGKVILDNMNLKNNDLKVGINAIIGSMYKNGYISEIKNSILVSVNSNDQNREKMLQEELTTEIDSVLNNYNIESAIITQEYETSKKTDIASGKVQFIEKIIDSNLTNKNGKAYAFDELKNLSINELNAILNSKNKEIKNINSTGKASTKSYIGNQKAKEIAISNANLRENSIKDLEIELDYEYKMMIYEVSFDYQNKEYEYKINAITGDIINKEIEVDDIPVNNYSNNTSATNNNSENTNYIGKNKAKQIALSDALLKENDVRKLEIEFDVEYNKAIYEVSFDYQNKEYDYDIDAITGKILNRKIEIDD